jgi:hypothetical protein
MICFINFLKTKNKIGEKKEKKKEPNRVSLSIKKIAQVSGLSDATQPTRLSLSYIKKNLKMIDKFLSFFKKKKTSDDVSFASTN